MFILKGRNLLFTGLFLLLILAWSVMAAQTTTDNIKLDVRQFTLNNGMLFLVVERPTTPQVACRLAIRAGSALEETGKTGIAHLLEHMMFKGTKNFGTRDPEKDRRLQQEIETSYQIIRKEQSKRHPDTDLIRSMKEKMNELRRQVQEIYVPQAFSSQLGRNGAVGVNAFTTKDQTQYMASVPSDMIEQWFSIISEQLFEPSWREFYVEKEVVQREWAFRYINNPGSAAWLDLNATAYTAHPYRNPTIGWKSDMARYSTEDAKAFYDKYYKPANAVCVLVGDIDVQTAKRLAKIYFERYPAGNRAGEWVTGEPPQEGPRRHVRYMKGAKTPLVRINFHGARMGTPDFYALDALTMVLSHGRSARMTQNIVNKGLAVEAWAYNPDNRYAGKIILGGSPNEPEAPKKENPTQEDKRRIYLEACEDIEKRLLAEVERLKTEPVSDRELQRIKKLNRRGFLERMRNNEDLAGTLATLEVQVGWSYLMSYLERIEEVTADDIRRVAEKYIKTENRTSIFLIPGGDPDRPPVSYSEVRSLSGAAAGGDIKPASFANHSKYPTPEAWKHPLSFRREPKKIRYPRAETATLSGASVFYLPDRELPLIDMALFVKAGEVDVPDDKTGLAGILNGALIRGGTEKYPPRELAMALDENAIRLSVAVGEEETVIKLSVMKGDWTRGLGLLQEVLNSPRFDEKVFRVVKQQALTGLQRQSDRAETVARREAVTWHFNGHPYGRDPLKGLETIPGIDREDLRAFVETHFVPANMTFAVAGDIDKQAVLDGLQGLLKALPPRPAQVRRLDEPPANPPVMALIHKPGQVQAQVVMLLSSIRRTHPAYWKLSLLTDLLGGQDSLMYKRLRDDLGLVYSAYFYQSYKWKAGILNGYIGCKADKTALAVRETAEIMDRLNRDIPKDLMERKRLDVLNSFVFNVDTPQALVNVYARYHMRRESLDTLERIQEAYIQAGREELRDLATRFLVPKVLQIFIVADRNTPTKGPDESTVPLHRTLGALAQDLGLPYKELPLR